MPNENYGPKFFQKLVARSREAAAATVPTIVELFRPSSVIDIGGGVGTWAAAFVEQGVTDALVVDGDYVDRLELQVPAESFVAHDLTQPLDLGRTFDLVLSLEVAEHLDDAHALTFVDSLVRHGDLIVFGAAIPGQGGTHHVNEQWPSYWADLFDKRGFEVFDVLRPRLWNETRSAFWFRQNMLVFAKGEAAERARAIPLVSGPLDVVHPEQFEYWLRILQQGPDIRQAARALGVGMWRRAARLGHR